MPSMIGDTGAIVSVTKGMKSIKGYHIVQIRAGNTDDCSSTHFGIFLSIKFYIDFDHGACLEHISCDFAGSYQPPGRHEQSIEISYA